MGTIMQNNNRLEGTISWRSPSNIALIKYWGKFDGQIPANPSLSMTLKNAYTETVLQYQPANTNSPEILVDGNQSEKFTTRIQNYFEKLQKHFPEIGSFSFRIKTHNTFPHSAGIASSASGFSALALCLLTWHENIRGNNYDDFFRMASDLARQGSGSASRSVYGGMTVWGNHPDVAGSSDYFAIPVPVKVHPLFADLKDTILIVDSGEKQVSSSMGHASMTGHPFAEARYRQANANLSSILKAITTGNWQVFQDITENEALTLHSLMMSAQNGYTLLKPDTLNILQEIKKIREQRQLNVCFTLDAGPNVHLIYPASESDAIKPWIEKTLPGYCENHHRIEDETGNGPVLLKNEKR